MRRQDIAFWAKIALTSLFVNVPLAVGMVVYGMHPAIAFGFAALAGMGTLVIWDGSRERAEEDAEAESAPAGTHTGSIRQVDHQPASS